jgi:alkylation response protein AidB-like acyl-CoA dehydrogenase
LYTFYDAEVAVVSLATSHVESALRDAAAQLARDTYAPRAVEWDTAGTPLPAAERARLAELGFLGVALPEEFGGLGASLLDALSVLEEVAKVSQIAAWPIFEANCGAARVIDLYGTPEQQQRVLPSITSGARMMSVAISEPHAGSAATDLSTTARRDGDRYIVNGTKRWCSGAGHAELYLVYARLSEALGAKGIGAIIVERDAPGVSFGQPEHLMGFHGIPSADIYLDNVEVSLESIVVGAGGFRDLFAAFSIERMGNAAMSLAIGQACLDRCAHYVEQRTQFGKPLVEFQLVQASLADMVMDVAATRRLIEHAARDAGRGAPSTLDASIAKCFANEMAKRVSDAAIQLHGGYGYSVEYGIERMHRDAHGWALGGGTPNMQRIRIASEFLDRRFDQRG